MSLKIGSKKWKSLIKKYRYYKKTLNIWTFDENVDQQVCQIININSQCTVMSVSILYLEVCFYFVLLCLFLFCTAMSVSILYRDVCFYFVPWCLFLFCTVMSVSILYRDVCFYFTGMGLGQWGAVWCSGVVESVSHGLESHQRLLLFAWTRNFIA